MAGWTFGVEQEVSPGNYACLLEIVEGWAIWTFDTASGKYLGINKPSVNKPHPVPLGYHQAFFSPEPYVSIIVGGPKIRAWPHGKHGCAQTEFRVVGDRFMAKWDHLFDPLHYDGKVIEAVIKSMPTERSYSKMVTEHARFDFTGAEKIIEAARRVDGVKPF